LVKTYDSETTNLTLLLHTRHNRAGPTASYVAKF
jgi:hypothetical protein